MKRNTLTMGLSRALACVALLPAGPVLAAQSATPDATIAGAGEPRQLDTVVVQAEITYRNRTADIAPVLSYDLEYFQRFEPSTVGDMIKRLPSATFVSDVLEYDAVQLRGLAPSYTRVLINGKDVPGAGDDRSFWVDRIPAEMVERIEIIRSGSANRSGDAIAGAINIILRDAYEFDGAYLRVGAMRYDDGEVQPTYGGVASGEALGGRILAGFNVQDRYNPKIKRSDRFDNPDDMNLVSWEDQTDTRDGQDYSGNLSWTADVGQTGNISIDGFYVKTDREQVEISHEEEYDDDEVVTSDVPGLVEVDQSNWGLGIEYAQDMAGGTTEFGIKYAGFKDRSNESEEKIEFVDGEWDAHEAEALDIDVDDRETGLTATHKRNLGNSSVRMEFGVDYRDKERDTTHVYYAFEAEDEGDPVVYEEDGFVHSLISETRMDPYLMFSSTVGALSWEAGLRWETTDSDITYRGDLDDPAQTASQDYDVLLPSAHLKWDLTGDSRINVSVARSLRRPDFNHIIPALLSEEFGDNDFIGNPQLEPETANGLDLGFEQQLGTRGVAGINVFYRDVKDVIELVNTGVPNETALDNWADDVEDYMDEHGVDQDTAEAAVPFDPDSFIYTMDNVGDGSVWGVELDVAAPLAVIGLPNTGVFANYSWLDSEIEDFIGKRRFNNQPRYVYNVGFIQDLPDLAVSFGASYRKQGNAFSRVLGEEVRTTYDADLEVFIEKRFGDSFAVRLSGANLLDAKKRERFGKFDNEADQVDRDFDEYEIESEWAGPRYQLVMRWSF